MENQILRNDNYYLTDGGLETTLVFHEGIDLPHFAAFELLSHPEGKNTFINYFTPYLDLARQYNLNFILESPTWRANTDWGIKLGYNRDELMKINMQALQLMQEVKQSRGKEINHILVSGNIGPRGDGYVAEKKMNSDEAESYHRLQVEAFTKAGADVVTALTLNYSDEAAGIIKAAESTGINAVISFTVETDGNLPSGEPLSDAIEKTDEMTNGYASHYMINCAHPTHFKDVLEQHGGWKARIKGIRANASVKSHAELDESETLDTGDACELADGYADLKSLLPDLRVIGGCCGTDHSHMEQICKQLLPIPLNR